MKKIFVCMALAFSMAAKATPTDNDTVIVERPKKVRIITGDSVQSVEVWGKEGNQTFHYVSNIQLVDSNYVSTSAINDDTWSFSIAGFSKPGRKKSRTECSTHLAVGFNNAVGMPTGADIQPFKSWEFWWIVTDWTYRPWRNNHFLSMGLGLDWRNYRMTDDLRFVKDNRSVALDNYPAGSSPQFSRIKVFSVNLPIRYGYEGKWFGFSLGPVINFNTYGSLKTRYEKDGHQLKDVDKDVRITPVTVDFMGTFSIRGVPDFYFKYSPCNLLRDGYGPKFRTLSFGLMF